MRLFQLVLCLFLIELNAGVSSEQPPAFIRAEQNGDQDRIQLNCCGHDFSLNVTDIHCSDSQSEFDKSIDSVTVLLETWSEHEVKPLDRLDFSVNLTDTDGQISENYYSCCHPELLALPVGEENVIVVWIVEFGNSGTGSVKDGYGGIVIWDTAQEKMSSVTTLNPFYWRVRYGPFSRHAGEYVIYWGDFDSEGEAEIALGRERIDLDEYPDTCRVNWVQSPPVIYKRDKEEYRCLEIALDDTLQRPRFDFSQYRSLPCICDPCPIWWVWNFFAADADRYDVNEKCREMPYQGSHTISGK